MLLNCIGLWSFHRAEEQRLSIHEDCATQNITSVLKGVFSSFFLCSLPVAQGMRNNGSTTVHHVVSVLPHLCTFHKQFPLGTYCFQGHWKSRTKHRTCLMAWLLDFKKAKVGPSPIHLQSTLLYLSLTGKYIDLWNLLTNQFSLFSF